jgi:hypothetical protein
LGAVSKIIRFSLLPNTLILPLTSLRFVTQCRQEYIIYTADTTVGFSIYCWLIFDLVSIVALYGVALTVFKGQALGKTWYRFYKAVSVGTTLVALNFFFIDLYCCFNWNFLLGLQILLQLSFTIDLTWGFSPDAAKSVACVVVALDSLQFAILIMSLLCPLFLNKASRFMPGWLQGCTGRPADIGDTASNRLEGAEYTSLLKQRYPATMQDAKLAALKGSMS